MDFRKLLNIAYLGLHLCLRSNQFFYQCLGPNVANMLAIFLAFDSASLRAGISTTSSASISPSISASVPASASSSVSATASLSQSAFKSFSDPPKVPAFASVRVSTSLSSIASALRLAWSRQMCRLVLPLVCHAMCRPWKGTLKTLTFVRYLCLRHSYRLSQRVDVCLDLPIAELARSVLDCASGSYRVHQWFRRHIA